MPIQCSCLICHATFFAKPYKVREGKGKFCSKACHKVAQRNSLAAFWDKVEVCAHGMDCPYCCWPWRTKPSKYGYGRFKWKGHAIQASRMAWQVWHNQECSPALPCAHYCHNRPCCNFDHLHACTQKENMADSLRDERLRRGSGMGKSLIVESDIPVIFALYVEGARQREIAKRFGVSQATIFHILSRRTWTHVPVVPHAVAPNRKPRGTEHFKSKIDEDDVLQIFRWRAEGMTLTAIAERLSITHQSVALILRRINWRHFPIPSDLLVAVDARYVARP